MTKKTTLSVYTIIDNNQEDQKDYWLRVGSAWKNDDGSINIKLNALPVNGRLQVREPNEDNQGEK